MSIKSCLRENLTTFGSVDYGHRRIEVALAPGKNGSVWLLDVQHALGDEIRSSFRIEPESLGKVAEMLQKLAIARGYP